MELRLQDPAEVEKLRAAGRQVGRHNFAAANAPEARAKASRAIRAAALPWCPEQYWDLNTMLRRKGLRLAERKAVILALVPGTPEHARIEIANRNLAQRLRAERERAQAY